MSVTIKVTDASALPIRASGTTVILVEDGGTGVPASGFYPASGTKIKLVTDAKDIPTPTSSSADNVAIKALEWLICCGARVYVVKSESNYYGTAEFKSALEEASIITEAINGGASSTVIPTDLGSKVFLLPMVAQSKTTPGGSGIVAGYFANYPGALEMETGISKGIVPMPIVAAGIMSICDSLGGPWLVPAGNTRGNLGTVYRYMTYDAVSHKYVESSIPSTEDANTIIRVGSDVFLAGNYANAVNGSSSDVGKASNMTNVRRLLVYLLREIEEISYGILYEYNTSATWNQWVDQVNQILDPIISGGGIVNAQVKMDMDLMTESDLIDGICRGRVVLQVPGVIRQVTIDLVLTNSDSSFSAQVIE